MQRKLSLLTAVSAIAAISLQCSDGTSDDTGVPAGGAPAGGAAVAGAAQGGVAGAAQGGVAGAAAGAPSAGQPAGGSGGGTAGGGVGGGTGAGTAGMGGLPGGTGGTAGSNGGNGGKAGGGAAGASGSGVGGGSGGAAVTFAAVSKILNDRCVNCHNGSAHMDLRTNDGLYERLTTPITGRAQGCNGKTLVVPSMKAMSFLLNKVEPDADRMGCGAVMPKGCSMNMNQCLSDMDVQTLENWIQAGAPKG